MQIIEQVCLVMCKSSENDQYPPQAVPLAALMLVLSACRVMYRKNASLFGGNVTPYIKQNVGGNWLNMVKGP